MKPLAWRHVFQRSNGYESSVLPSTWSGRQPAQGRISDKKCQSLTALNSQLIQGLLAHHVSVRIKHMQCDHKATTRLLLEDRCHGSSPWNASSLWQNFELSIINSLGSAGYGHIEGRAWLTLPWSWPHSRKVATRKQEDWTVDSIHTNSSSAYQLGDVSVAAGPQSECGPVAATPVRINGKLSSDGTWMGLGGVLQRVGSICALPAEFGTKAICKDDDLALQSSIM